MSTEDSQDVIKALKAQQQVNGTESPAAANGNGVHHEDGDEADGCGSSKTRQEEKQAIVELKEAVLADESFSSNNEALAKKVEAAVTALDEAVSAAEQADTKEREAVSALDDALLSNGVTPEKIEEAVSAVHEAAAKDQQAESALDEAVLVVGEAVIKNLDKAVSAVDGVAASAPAAETPKPEPVASAPAPVVEVTPAPQQEEEEDEEVAPVEKEAPKKASAAPEPTPEAAPAKASPAESQSSFSEVIPAMQGVRQEWFKNRQSSEERRREVEAESRPTVNKAALSTSIDESSVRAAYEDVRSDTTDTEWAVFKFQDQKIVCSATGEGFDSFRGHFADNERVFGFIRIQMGDEMSKRQKFVFLTWVGPRVSVIRRAKMSIDKAMVKNIVKNFAVELQVESQSEINVEYLRDQLARVGGANYGTGFRD
ncbi:myristoylated alanine-rich C-kinase substrate [Thrips palmi]|uniref:Coactosin-like protein n=1 Tax=Thrips palmi TaxID=161013 RepID=A0A6P8ZNT1_THRPL|nr:myristoylated alanine-rich C-kinase substrate [Thrips palmi]